MKLYRLSLLAFVALMIVSCKTAPKAGLVVSGTVSDANDMTVYFDRTLPDNASEGILNTKADGNGNFEFTFPEKLKAGTYRIRAGAKAAEILLNGTETSISLEGDMKSFGDLSYSVKGSPLTEEYLSLISSYMSKKLDTQGLSDKAMNELDPLIGYQVSSKMFRLRPEFLNLHKAVAAKLTSTYPDLELTKSFAAQVTSVERQYAAKLASEKIKVGQPAPNISLPGVDGKTRSLSDMKGKLVLLDFWASWCGPCRKANPKVVDVYKRYKDKGFDVFSVSLDGLDSRTKARYGSEDQVKMQMDRSKERWFAAIEKDNLIWDGHVSDLKKWESAPAASYGVKSIPKTFLIGKDGNIAYINPRNNLEEVVKTHLGLL
jgi:peroxiredoxin